MSVSADVAGPRAGVGARGVAAAHWHRAALALTLVLAALLDLLHLGQNGYANTYYSAAVRSMGLSWRNFFFASFDPGGLVTVDKPPLALWLQVASVKLFGYSGVAILLPEALCGVAAVAVLYALVARYFGRVAGLVAALVLAVSPVSVAVNRDNNPDALFVLLLVVAAYFGARAVESGRTRHLLAAAVAIGLAFETKMLAALIVLPGIALAYALFSPASWRRRAWQLAVGTAVLVVVSGAWVAAVELTPAADRPYVGSTTDNSALSLLFGYNGLGRIDGQQGGTSFGGRGAGGLGGAFSGTPGAFRLLNDALGDQAAWLLPLAIVGGLAALIFLVRERRRRELGALVVIGGWFLSGAVIFSYASGIVHTYYLSALAPATCALAGLGAVALYRAIRLGRAWLVLPAVAFAATAWLQVVLLRRSGYLPGLQALVIAAALAAGALIVLAAVLRRRPLAVAAVACAVGGFLAAPAVWAATTLKAPVNGVFPGAGPSFVSGLGANSGGLPFGGRPGFGRGFGRPGGGFGRPPGAGRGFGFRAPGGFGPPAGGFGRPGGGFGRPGGGFGRLGGFGGADTATALSYARAHGATSRFALIVSSEEAAAQYVIDGDSIAAMGGFTGRETVLSRPFLARIVRTGEARYFLVDSSGSGVLNAGSVIVSSACRPVPTATWGGASGALYDCAGRAAALAGRS